MVREVRELFREEEVARHDFSGAPARIARREPASAASDPSWARAQRSFLRWTRDRIVFTREAVEGGRSACATLFARRGPLAGSVLDIGGGWGLYREWWEPGEGDVFVVHDPGLERFDRGPHALHREVYGRAFGLPMTFVEGFGEELPYREGVFDTCLAASVLDHCLDPGAVLAGARRCLRPGGRILVLQSCPPAEGERERPSRPRRLLARLRSPGRFLREAYGFLLHRDRHLHRFTPEGLAAMLEAAGFAEVAAGARPGPADLHVFEGRRPGGGSRRRSWSR